MRKLIWVGGEEFALHEGTGPPPEPHAGEVLVRVRAIGICGTDIHIQNGSLPGAKPPMVLGHEIAGEIAKTGPGVNSVAEGDRVTVDSVVGCGDCFFCARGKRQFCLRGYELGINHDGGCQDFVVVPAENVHRVPNAISMEEAAVLDIEVRQAIRRCGIEPCDRTVILGGGPIGLIAAQVVRLLGASKILLVEPNRERLGFAKRLGLADVYVDELSQTLSATLEMTEGLGASVVIDCAGTARSTQDALAIVRPTGRLLLYGVYEESTQCVDLNQVVLKDLTVFGSLCERSGWQDVIDLVADGKLSLAPLITHRFPLEQAAAAYKLVRAKADGVIKAVLTF